MLFRPACSFVACGVALFWAVSAALAAPVVDETFAMRLQNSANSNNYATGPILFWGANNVSPAATSYGVTRQCPTGALCTSPSDPDYVYQALYYRSFSAIPNQWFASRPYDPDLTNPWTLVTSSTPNFAPGTNTLVDTPAVGSVAQMPFVRSMSVSGTGVTPTIGWALPVLPAGLSIDRVSVRVFDLSNPVVTTSRSPSLVNSFSQADFLYVNDVAPGSRG